LRRAQVLLAVDEVRRPEEAAKAYGAGRSTVYRWLQRYGDERRAEPMPSRLADRKRTGRPPKEREAAKAMVAELLGESPQSHGYRQTTWTVPLLERHLRVVHGQTVSDTTLRRAIHDLNYRWKRPRYQLSRRAKHWRQAKGGSNAA